MSDFKLQSVNWQDGMLITRQHLQDQGKFHEELSRWHAFGGGDYYGLVRKSVTGKPALSLNMSVSGNRVQVEVKRCQAITPGGFYIEITESAQDIIRCEGEINETTIPVFVGIDPEGKRQVGDPNPEEDLARVPYLINRYQAYLGEPEDLPKACYLQVAELVISGSEAMINPGYYPPCLNLHADDNLAQHVMDMRNRLENLLMLSTKAFKAISGGGALAKASTSLQVAFKEVINPYVYHLAATLDRFVVGANSGHPLGLVIHFKSLFRVFSTLLNLQPILKDYLNEKFFTKEAGTDVESYLSKIEDFILSSYNHRNIGGHIKAIDDILGILRGMMQFLAQTKRDDLGEQAVATETLTYQGRTFRNLEYGTCRLEQVGELSYLIITISKPSAVSDTVLLMNKTLFSDGEWRNMQVRLGTNDARGLGETDPVDVDTSTFGNKVALHPRDMLESSSVKQLTIIFRGAPDPGKFENLGHMDLIVYSV